MPELGEKYMDIIVQKFGGTSVATKEAREKVIDRIVEIIEQDKFPVVVVSAIGRKGDPYATDTLIRFVTDINDDLNPRELDALMTCGEIISSVMLVNTLQRKGFDAISLTGAQAGILTDNQFGNAEVLNIDTKNILDILEQGKIPVVCGFQGITEDGHYTTLGRGGSDTTASLLGEALQAQKIEIYTDVDGIMTTDPKICKEAKVIELISYHEVFQMAGAGAKVIHPKAVEIAMRANIPLLIKNTFSHADGTMITRYSKQNKNYSPSLITGIAHMSGKAQIHLKEMETEDSIFFTELAEEGISIDIINIFPTEKLFTVKASDIKKAKQILEKYHAEYHINDHCCKITLIGERIAGVPGIMAKIIRTLSQVNVKILQTADSHTTISCLIHSDDTCTAISALHKAFYKND